MRNISRFYYICHQRKSHSISMSIVTTVRYCEGNALFLFNQSIKVLVFTIFQKPKCSQDTLNNCEYLRDVYRIANPGRFW